MTASPRPRRPRHPSRPPIRAPFGSIPDIPDQRVILSASVRPVVAAPRDTVDFRSLCSTVEDQGSLGSCTAQALVGALEYLERKDSVPFADLIRLFVYYNERVIEHSVRTGTRDRRAGCRWTCRPRHRKPPGRRTISRREFPGRSVGRQM